MAETRDEHIRMTYPMESSVEDQDSEEIYLQVKDEIKEYDTTIKDDQSFVNERMEDVMVSGSVGEGRSGKSSTISKDRFEKVKLMQQSDKELNEKLICLVEERPSLYDHKDPLYHDRNLQDYLWQQIGSKLSMTAGQAKKKWQTLRASFSRSLQEEKPLPNGSLAKKPKTEWYLSNQMSFLIPFMKHAPISGNFTSAATNDVECVNSLPPDISVEQTPKNDVQGLSESPRRRKVKKDKYKGSLNSVDEMMLKCISSQAESSNCSSSSTGEEDFDLSFFKSILSDMRQLNPRKKRKFKIKVLELLDTLLDDDDVSITLPNINRATNYETPSSVSLNTSQTRYEHRHFLLGDVE